MSFNWHFFPLPCWLKKFLLQVFNKYTELQSINRLLLEPLGRDSTRRFFVAQRNVMYLFANQLKFFALITFLGALRSASSFGGIFIPLCIFDSLIQLFYDGTITPPHTLWRLLSTTNGGGDKYYRPNRRAMRCFYLPNSRGHISSKLGSHFLLLYNKPIEFLR